MIEGYFISVEVPEVAVGEDIKATVDFYALNPTAIRWVTWLIADSPGLGLRKILDQAGEWGQDGGRKKTYNLGKMPDREIAITFMIWAHDDAGHDWSWPEYEAAMEGWSAEVEHLASEYRFISPAPTPGPGPAGSPPGPHT